MAFEQLGPYQIVRKLGRGGMGVVYEGIDVETGQKAAVKVLSAALCEEQDFRNRFEGEIEALRKLKHPNIVRLFGFGHHEDQLFYAMELVDGESLESELRRGRRFDWREVVQFGIGICLGLRHAHDRGVIHRDIKPGNLLMAPGETIKLSDFGIAQLFGRGRLTSVGNVVGTVEYMAPEQAEARAIDQRADLYSLGGVFYALLAQRPPLRAQTVAEILEKQRTTQPEPVRRFAPDVPDELEQLIGQLLERDPNKRIPNAALVGRRLETMLRALSPDTDVQGEDPGEPGFDLAQPAVQSALPPRADPGELPPTRVIEDEGNDPSTASYPAPAPSQLAETKPMSEVQPAAAPPAWHEAAAVETVPPQARKELPPDSHFTSVADEELDQQPASPDRPALISVQTWVLAVGLIAVGLGVWYLLQPPSADNLYERIMVRSRDGTLESLRAAEPDIGEFLTRYSDDSRAGELRQLEREIDLDRLERRFELRASGRISTAERLSPAERAYLEAINYVRLDPEMGMAKLQALIDLYDHRTDRSGPTGQCLEIARRRLDRLREELQERTASQVAVIEGRLDRADELSKTDPAAARAIRKAVFELYGSKPWAAKAVRRSRSALDNEDRAKPRK
jgi:serine/threonine protein kinase